MEVQVKSKSWKMRKPDVLRYSNCWEDADLLLEMLDIQPNDVVLSIGSGGDNSFSLLSKSPKTVVAIDPNPLQLHLIRLKAAAFQTFDYQSFLAFLGFKDANNRLELFTKICQNLPKDTAQFWEENVKQIEEGVIFAGKFDRYLRFFAQRIVPLIHTKNGFNSYLLLSHKKPKKSFMLMNGKTNVGNGFFGFF